MKKVSTPFFLDDMENALKGQESSLMMVPTYIKIENEISINKPVIAIDVDGTNFRRTVIHFDRDRKSVLEDLEVFPVPGTKGTITKEEFFATVAKHLELLIRKSEKISFCFSYHTVMYPNNDGKLVKSNREVQKTDTEVVVNGEGSLKAIRFQLSKRQRRISFSPKKRQKSSNNK